MKIKIKDMIKALQTAKDQDAYVYVASDEEWNNIYTSILLQKDSSINAYVIFGLSGSELEDE